MARKVASSNVEPAMNCVPVTELDFNRREMMFKSVVLPHPEGPMRARRAPWGSATKFDRRNREYPFQHIHSHFAECVFSLSECPQHTKRPSTRTCSSLWPIPRWIRSERHQPRESQLQLLVSRCRYWRPSLVTSPKQRRSLNKECGSRYIYLRHDA